MTEEFTTHNMKFALGYREAKKLSNSLNRTALGVHKPLYIKGSNKYGECLTTTSVVHYKVDECLRWYAKKRDTSKNPKHSKMHQETMNRIIKVKVTCDECFKGINPCED